jgi:hypothetical protein
MNTIGILIVVAIVVAAVIGFFVYLSKRSLRLRKKFGPEYTRTVEETGNKYKAESKLERLEKRVDKFSVHPLQPEEAFKFQDSWRVIQAGFVDDPRTALSAADRLVGEVMDARGYPVADFEERASELSVNHALVVEHYRAGHEIAIKHIKGQATTEDMRQAMIHYRTLFDDLLGIPEKARTKGAGSYT